MLKRRVFQPADLLLRIQPAATASGDMKLQRQVVAGPQLVNTETPEVRGLTDSSQMEQLPTDRGFIDLTRLESGVQLLDARDRRPPRAGFQRRPLWAAMAAPPECRWMAWT